MRDGRLCLSGDTISVSVIAARLGRLRFSEDKRRESSPGSEGETKRRERLRGRGQCAAHEIKLVVTRAASLVRKLGEEVSVSSIVERALSGLHERDSSRSMVNTESPTRVSRAGATVGGASSLKRAAP